jgi:Zn-dependent protease with chaperone function
MTDARTSRWIACRRWIHIVLLGTVATWWALEDFERESARFPRLALRLSWIDPALVKPLLFWALLVGGIAIVQLVCYFLDRRFLGRGWTVSDVLRLACWRTVSPTVALVFVATGFDAIYDRNLGGILWLVAAAMLAMVGGWRLRSAEGIKLHRVKSGELYKRAFVMAKRMETPLRRVYVVPAGRGHLANAYGLSHSIAVTDNYGKFLDAAELDFVIGHELGHVKAQHGRKNLLIMAAVFAGIAVVYFFLPPVWRFRPFLDISAMFLPILTFYFLSRRFEYAADKTGVELTQDPENAIRALANLYRMTQAPKHCDRLTELFMTHPSLVRRVRAIGESGRMPAERISEAIDEM